VQKTQKISNEYGSNVRQLLNHQLLIEKCLETMKMNDEHLTSSLKHSE